MALTSDDPTGQAARSPGGHAVYEFVGAECPGTALGLDAVESALGAFFAGLEVALEGAAVFVAGEVHQVGFGGAVLAGVGESGVAQVVQIPAVGDRATAGLNRRLGVLSDLGEAAGD
ncbi:hypothetical protein [Planotetraspora mira]|uniref:hypothetical protein n=1 Tax=Planotetraspora mira TaxID=58121 RepID=UPI00194F40CB|nr:hypothetical protein [Planotetraspora mira]